MTEAVRDGITVNLVYDGRAAKVMLDQEKVKQIEEYYAQCEREGANEHQIEESQNITKIVSLRGLRLQARQCSYAPTVT